MQVEKVASLAESVIDQIEKVIVGKRHAVQQAVLTMLCNGHLLIEDIPGVGKTTLAKALAISIGGEFRRIQFTPDLLPTDVTGTQIYNQKEGTFEFRPGPIFANVVLVDEINRATPKTQSSLLEAMEERQVTSDGSTRALPPLFFVMATQNNIEMTGTFPLPEAQMDRFFARVSLGYPDRQAETDILLSQQIFSPLESLEAITNPEEIYKAQTAIREVFVHPSVREYVVDIVRATREHTLLNLGASPRAALHLMHAAQAYAVLNLEKYVRPDDVKAVARIILSHRIIPRGEVRARGTSNEHIIEQILDSIPAPLPIS